MDIILWRHAQAEDLNHMQSDNDRKLTAKGQKQATQMASWLSSVLPSDCKILVSPSQRTLQTAKALGRQFNIVNEIGTTSSADRILAVCCWPHARTTVLVVGHQPLLSQIVSRLIPEIHGVNIRKGNVWWISQHADGEVFLKAVMAPDLVVWPS